jgi:leucyl/phenylalanyl-tRNA--protein transferase
MRRWALGLVWPLKPPRLAGVPSLLWLWLLSRGRKAIPDPEGALERPYGLAGFVSDLSAPTLIHAYKAGLYPFCHVGPLKWWSPPERCVVPLAEFHVSRRIRSRMRQNKLRVTFDEDFEGVIKACAEPRDGKSSLTWITPRIMHAYADLFDAGRVHSFEVWNECGALVGGGYGVAVSGVFVVESQFAREPGASQIGFAVLAAHLRGWGFTLLDNKIMTSTVERMGFSDVPRGTYLKVLRSGGPERAGRWRAELDSRRAEAVLAAGPPITAAAA